MRVSTRLTMLVSAALLAVTLTACGGGAAPSGGTGGGGGGAAAAGSPTDAAKAFFAAVFSGNDINPYLCTTNADAAKAISQGMSTMKTSLEASGAKIDTSGLVFDAGTVSGDTAQVKVSGKLKTTVAGTSVDSDYPAATIPMRNEGGNWKVCG
jgi:hypothetical protein